MALKEGVLSYVKLEPRLLVLTVVEPNLDHSLWVMACPEVHLVLESLLPTIHHDISNEMSDWVVIP